VAGGGPESPAAQEKAPASRGLNLPRRPPAGRASRPVWALDFQFDQTANGRILKLLNIVDEHSWEELGGLVERRIDTDRTVAALEAIVRRARSRRCSRAGCRRCWESRRGAEGG
jgi:hypothetical protein